MKVVVVILITIQVAICTGMNPYFNSESKDTAQQAEHSRVETAKNPGFESIPIPEHNYQRNEFIEVRNHQVPVYMNYNEMTYNPHREPAVIEQHSQESIDNRVDFFTVFAGSEDLLTPLVQNEQIQMHPYADNTSQWEPQHAAPATFYCPPIYEQSFYGQNQHSTHYQTPYQTQGSQGTVQQAFQEPALYHMQPAQLQQELSIDVNAVSTPSSSYTYGYGMPTQLYNEQELQQLSSSYKPEMYNNSPSFQADQHYPNNQEMPHLTPEIRSPSILEYSLPQEAAEHDGHPTAKRIREEDNIMSPEMNAYNSVDDNTTQTYCLHTEQEPESVESTYRTGRTHSNVSTPILPENPVHYNMHSISCTASSTYASNTYEASTLPDFFLKKWQITTLNDSRRNTLRKEENIVPCKISDEAEVGKGEEWRLGVLEVQINRYEKGQNIWDLVMNMSIEKENRYKDFLIIHSNKNRFDKKLSEFVGYYDDFFKDLAEYMKEHIPRIYTKECNTILNPPARKDTLGDIYLKNSIDVESINNSIRMSNTQSNYFDLKNMPRIILSMPEIYKDLTSIPVDLFKKILQEMEADSSTPVTRLRCLLVSCLFKVVRSKFIANKGAEYVSICNKIFDTIKELAEEDQRTVHSYKVEEIYLETYNAMCLFYKHAPYFYEDSNLLHKIVGKDIIVE